ncbi:MAG: redoxin domain-containing protein [Bdellovibrionales bacterium]|nr:redoxin domain-containing protein [Bdellovibrionales bacterium]
MKSVNLRIFFGVCLFFSVGASAAIKPAANRKAAPNFTLKGLDGKDVALSSLKGKVVLLNFWATWCGPCKKEIPWFVEFQKQHQAKGLVVLGVSADDDVKEVQDFLKSVTVNYPIVMGTEATMKQYGGVESLPTSFLIDRQGRVAGVHTGLVERAEYVRDLEALLGK